MPTARQVFCDGPQSQEAQRKLEDRFFRELRMPNGTFKTTTAGRLAAFDELILSHLGTRSDIVLLDVGIASGATTIDLADRLRDSGRTYRIVAADRYLNAKLLRLGQRLEVLLSRDDDVLQLSCGEWTRPLYQGSSRWRRAVLQLGLDAVASLATRWGAREDIKLVTVGLQNRGEIYLVEQDIQQFEPAWEDQFDVIRGANVLNLAYFKQAELEEIVRHLGRYLKDEGLLAICRSDEETHRPHGSIFVKDTRKGAMRAVAQTGRGSEINEIVLNMRP